MEIFSLKIAASGQKIFSGTLLTVWRWAVFGDIRIRIRIQGTDNLVTLSQLQLLCKYTTFFKGSRQNILCYQVFIKRGPFNPLWHFPIFWTKFPLSHTTSNCIWGCSAVQCSAVQCSAETKQFSSCPAYNTSLSDVQKDPPGHHDSNNES